MKAEKVLAKGQALEKKGKRDQALALYREACRANPYDPDLWTARAETAKQLGLTAEAAEALFRVSDLFVRGGMPREALKLVRRVLDLDPDHGGARRFLRMLETRVEVISDAEGAPQVPLAMAPTQREATPMEVASAPTQREEAPRTESSAPFGGAQVAAPSEMMTPATTQKESAVDVEPKVIILEVDEPGEEQAARPDEPAPEEPARPPPQLRLVASQEPSREFAMGVMTGELALDTLSLRERFAQADGQDIPIDDEGRLDVVVAVASTLSSSPLLSELDSDLVRMLIECASLVHRATGTTVFKQGDLGTSLYLILKGEVAVVREKGGGREQELARLRAGAFFGEMGLLTNTARTATIRALKPLDLLEMSRSAVLKMVDRDSRVLKLLMRFFRARLVGTLLQTSPLFRPFTREKRRELVPRFRLRELPGDTEVIREGGPVEGLFVVLTGKLEAVLAGKVLGNLVSGDVFGEMSLLDASPATATVRTKGRAWVLLLPRLDFESVVRDHPHVVAQLAQVADSRRAQNRATLGDDRATLGDERLDPV